MIQPTTTSYDEKEVLQLISHKNKNAFNFLYDKYAPALYSIILKLLPDQQKAGDALAQTFLDVWRTAGEYNAETERLFTWLRRKAVHIALYSFGFSATIATAAS